MTEQDKPLYRFQEKGQSQSGKTEEQQDNKCLCPYCGHGVKVTADICEHCSKWLLDGKCCFCYAEVKPGQKFCRECGNPPTGIICPQCQTLSQFDFCPACDTAVSKRAKPFLEAFQQSPALLELMQLGKSADEASTDSKTKASGTDAPTQLQQLKAYLSKFDQRVEKQPQPGFSFNNKNTDASEALEKTSALDHEMPKPDVAALEQELMQKIAMLQKQTFSDNQSARMFYAALKVMLPELVKTKEKRLKGWLCNYANVVHQAPHQCCEPNLGGEWLYESYTTYDTIYTEH